MAEKLDYTNPCPRCGDAAMPEKYRVLGCAMNYACESMVSTEGLFIAGRPCLLRQLAAANERAGRLEANLRSLCERLDKWWYEADPMGDVNKGERHPWTVAARKALEVPDAL
jgi:hypothetical protein